MYKRGEIISMLSFILFESGECQSNIQYMYLPPEIDFITENGKLQASLLGKSLKDITFTQVYVSTYSRALETVKAILEQIPPPKPEVILDHRIREREMGIFENKPVKYLSDTIYSAWKEHGTTMLEFELPNGESLQNFEDRIESFLEDILKLIRERDKPQTILVVTHGVLIMRMLLKLRFWSRDISRPLTLNSFSLKHVTKTLCNTNYHLLSVYTAPEQTVIEFTNVHCSDHLDSLNPKQSPVPSKDQLELMKAWNTMVAEQCSMV